MGAVRARLAAVLAGLVVAALASWGVNGLGEQETVRIASWLDHTFDIALFVMYAVVHPWLQKRWNPTGAFTTVAAERLERAGNLAVRR